MAASASTLHTPPYVVDITVNLGALYEDARVSVRLDGVGAVWIRLPAFDGTGVTLSGTVVVVDDERKVSVTTRQIHHEKSERNACAEWKLLRVCRQSAPKLSLRALFVVDAIMLEFRSEGVVLGSRLLSPGWFAAHSQPLKKQLDTTQARTVVLHCGSRAFHCVNNWMGTGTAPSSAALAGLNLGQLKEIWLFAHKYQFKPVLCSIARAVVRRCHEIESAAAATAAIVKQCQMGQ